MLKKILLIIFLLENTLIETPGMVKTPDDKHPDEGLSWHRVFKWHTHSLIKGKSVDGPVLVVH